MMKKRNIIIRLLSSIDKESTLKSLFLKNLYSLLAIITIPLVSLALLVYFSYSGSMRKEFYSDIDKNVTKLRTEMENGLNQIRAAGFSLAYDTDVTRLAAFEHYKINNELLVIINDIKTKLNVYQSSSFVTTEMGIYYLDPLYTINATTSYSLFNFEYRKDDLFYIENILDSIKSDTKYRAFLSDAGLLSLCLLDNQEQEKGAVYTFQGYSDINSFLSGYIGRLFSNYYLVDLNSHKQYRLDSQSGNMMSSEAVHTIISSEDAFESVIIADREYIAVTSYFLDKSIALVILADATEYLGNKQSTLILAVIVIVIVILLSILASIYISWRFHQPIDVVLNLLKNPTPRAVTDYKESFEHLDELGIIAALINETRFREVMLQDELEQKKEVQDKIQKKLLQTQINPHFINNTLETINWKAINILGDENEISEMVSNFSKLLTISFRGLGQLVTVRSEIEHARLYMKFQQSRFSNKFSVTWDIASDAMPFFTLPLIMQPLLENAIEYGVKPLRNKKGLITLSCEKKSDRIEFSVSDNGSEISSDHFETMCDQLSIESLDSDNHIGISNVQQRIQLAFGSDFGISIEKNPFPHQEAGGLKVTVTLPIVTKSTL